MSRHTGMMLMVALLVVAAAQVLAEEKDTNTPDDALKRKLLELNEVTGTKPVQGRLKEMLDEKPEDIKKLLKQAYAMSREKNQPFGRNATLLFAMTAEAVKDVDTSAHFYKLNAEQAKKLISERGLAQAYLGLIQMYLSNKKYAESEKACKEILKYEGDEEGELEAIKPMIHRSLVMAIAKLGQTDRALRLVEALIKADPKNFLHVALKARVQREAEKFEDALKTYETVIKMVEKDNRIKDAVRQDYIDDYQYLMSGIHTELNQIDKTTDILKKLLEREPNNPTYNNDLGFTWADRGMNLEEAEKLIRKAIEEDRKIRKADPFSQATAEKDNPSFLDSLGWVLYKQGKPKDAKPYLLAAVKEKDGQHTEIFEHLGDVLMELGEKTEALEAWKKAIEVASESAREKKRTVEIKKKIEKLGE